MMLVASEDIAVYNKILRQNFGFVSQKYVQGSPSPSQTAYPCSKSTCGSPVEASCQRTDRNDTPPATPCPLKLCICDRQALRLLVGFIPAPPQVVSQLGGHACPPWVRL